MGNAIQTTVLLRSEQTGGMTSVIENVLPPRFGGPPLHMHDFDEAFYVLDGELTFQLDNERSNAGAGQLVFAPRCVPHTLANHSPLEARYLLICAPAGFERYFDRIAADQGGNQPPPESTRPFPETITLGPPLAPLGTADDGD
jgi:mannose-6-phosphate isomerase-like protein (cupin superfamily)